MLAIWQEVAGVQSGDAVTELEKIIRIILSVLIGMILRDAIDRWDRKM